MAITRTEISGHASGTEALFADLSYFPVQAIQVQLVASICYSYAFSFENQGVLLEANLHLYKTFST